MTNNNSFRDLENLAGDYPTIVTPILNGLRNLQSQVDSQGEAVESARTTAQEVSTKAHFRAIRDKHPDADRIARSDDFLGWIERHPTFATVVRNGNAEEVISMLDQYKEDVGTGRKSNSHARFTRAQIDAMSIEEFAKNEKAIDQAVANGEIQ